jgi:hypothetical protein
VGGFPSLCDEQDLGSSITKLLADVTRRKKGIIEGSGWKKIKD